ncbi:MAG: branched-chain amino acid ABC transporter permease [Spirochaeta sp.]
MLNFLMLLAILIGIYTILALSLNIITGYGGMLSLCHAAFFAIGAYTTAIATTRFAIGFWPSLLMAALLSMLLGILIGLPTIRLSGDYLAIATLGFAEITRSILLNWDAVTLGPRGIIGIPPIDFFTITIAPLNKTGFLIFTWAIVLITYAFFKRLMRSRIGRAIEAIREDEIAASSVGINTVLYKLVAFALSAFFAGFAGSLWAVYNQSVTPNTFGFMLSVMILCMVVLGGMGNHLAMIFGSTMIVAAAELPRLLGMSNIFPPQFRQILFGLVLVLMMIFRPQGLLGRRKPKFGKHAAAASKKREAEVVQ